MIREPHRRSFGGPSFVAVNRPRREHAPAHAAKKRARGKSGKWDLQVFRKRRYDGTEGATFSPDA